MTAELLRNFDDRDAADEWKTVDDVVMGGRSESRVHRVDDVTPEESRRSGILRFEGEVSLENNGGFCSMRMEEAARGLSDLRAFVLVARGDGKRYKFTLRTDDTPSSSSWRKSFETDPGEWRLYRFPLEQFELWRRGTRLSAERTPDPTGITSVGLLISDGQEGPFRIDLGELRGEHARRG